MVGGRDFDGAKVGSLVRLYGGEVAMGNVAVDAIN